MNAGQPGRAAVRVYRLAALNSYPVDFCQDGSAFPAAAGLACLAQGDLRLAVEYGANFGPDTDTIAAIAGALRGAAGGALPDAWLSQLGANALKSARTTAERLAATAIGLCRQMLTDVAAVTGLSST